MIIQNIFACDYNKLITKIIINSREKKEHLAPKISM